MILGNLTTGRSPWKQASAKEYPNCRAYTWDPNYLRITLPLSDELNDIPFKIFEPDPEGCINNYEFKEARVSCWYMSGSVPW